MIGSAIAQKNLIAPVNKVPCLICIVPFFLRRNIDTVGAGSYPLYKYYTNIRKYFSKRMTEASRTLLRFHSPCIAFKCLSLGELCNTDVEVNCNSQSTVIRFTKKVRLSAVCFLIIMDTIYSRCSSNY